MGQSATITPTEQLQDTETTPTEPQQKGCMLGRPLGDCSLRRAGCGSLFDVLRTVYPPQTLLTALRARQDLPPDIAKWLYTIESVTPQPRQSKAEARSAAILQLYNTPRKG